LLKTPPPRPPPAIPASWLHGFAQYHGPGMYGIMDGRGKLPSRAKRRGKRRRNSSIDLTVEVVDTSYFTKLLSLSRLQEDERIVTSLCISQPPSKSAGDFRQRIRGERSQPATAYRTGGVLSVVRPLACHGIIVYRPKKACQHTRIMREKKTRRCCRIREVTCPVH
jgi:hypothetical protein